MHQGRQILVLLAALLLPSPTLAAPSTAAIDRTPEIEEVRNDVASEIRIEMTSPGQEGLSLNARLSEDGGLINLPISWRVKGFGGETLLTRDADFAELAAEPGDYIVEARYGMIEIERKVTLLAGQHLGVTFVLNAGGLRILPKLQQIGLPAARPFTSIYKVSGIDGGSLVAITEEPGEILRVGAGSYRIESRFQPGNASAMTEVTVKPGLLSAVEIDLSAGIARLAAPGADDRDVVWFITDAKGQALPGVPGPAADVVLKPGRYKLRTQIDGREKDSIFTIEPGKISAIIQAN
ncbi:hypothetical protein G5V57_30060 [Nordella sp. HKS 07]|uniref:hypothetical protein n=1 Tax=Nordella sp. HKS 07 TaxID=2712222 RepID=UPI0013E197C1|nr:hypothetical protein [Nordella sp. HKS 07]QIG51585.1 hypothetical protein G5V57_30060 [Nordella sp. HKS 07]